MGRRLLVLVTVALVACSEPSAEAPADGAGGSPGGGGSGGGGGVGGAAGGGAGAGGAGGGGPTYLQVRDPDDFVVVSSHVAGSWYDNHSIQASGRWVVYRTLAADSNGACFTPKGTDPDCNYDLLGLDLETGAELQVAVGPGRAEEFVLDGDQVAWVDYLDDANDACMSIAEVDGDADCARGVSVRTLPDGLPRHQAVDFLEFDGFLDGFDLDGDRILVSVSAGNDLWLVGPDGGKELVVTGPDVRVHPDLSGDLLTWSTLGHDQNGLCYSGPGDRDCELTIWVHRLSTRESWEAGSSTERSAFYPRICGEALTWIDLGRDSDRSCGQKDPDDPDCVMDGVIYDVATREQRILHEETARLIPTCDATTMLVVAREGDSDGFCFGGPDDPDCGGRIVAYDLATGERHEVGTADLPRAFPVGSRGTVAFVEWTRECNTGSPDPSCELQGLAVRFRQ